MIKRDLRNYVQLIGTIQNKFQLDHETFSERFFLTEIELKRLSGAIDRLPVMVSERLADTSQDLTGKKVLITGQFRSYNQHDSEKSHLILFVFATEFQVLSDENNMMDMNSIEVDGFICKAPVYRTTPLGREISDILVAVNRSYGKSDYLPCICWGRNARFTEKLRAGDHIRIFGRLQSRGYVKHLENGQAENRTAYEISVSSLSVESITDAA